jgi:protein O-GlcNAc transferase
MNSADVFEQAFDAFKAGRALDAERLFKMVLDIQPAHVGALNLLAVILISMSRFSEAESFIDRAVTLNNQSDASYYNYGLILKKLKRPKEAIQKLNIALKINPNVAETWNSRGAVLNDLHQYEQAIADFDRALGLNRRYGEAACNKGNSLYKLQRNEEAIAAYGAALSFEPNLAEAWLGRGNVLWRFRQLNEALDAYERAVALKPTLEYAESQRLFTKMCACDWRDFSRDCERLTKSAIGKVGSPTPFVFLAVSDSAQLQREVAELRVVEQFPKKSPTLWAGEIYTHDRIHIAYVSADFREHPVSYLTSGLFEYHDKSRFKLTAISIGRRDDARIRRRIENTFDTFIDVANVSDDEGARRVREAEVDILVDLTGFTEDGRPGIFAFKPAPVIVNYMGYAGTMGADYFDYIIADSIVIRDEDRRYYAEKVVNLPHSFLANDSKRSVVGDMVNKSECDLPEEGFVFCCFNNSYKITPSVFHSWMEILRNVEGSVLWLREDVGIASVNLRKAAAAEGVSETRLVFAKRTSLPAHLARLRRADLFLDTLPYNAHTTALDALWAGVPVLTQIGRTFAGKVCASLLNAIDLTELVTHTPEEYRHRAIELAQTPAKMEWMKKKLERNRHTAPLFDTELFTKELESAYEEIYELYRRGSPPRDVRVSDLRSSARRV